MVATNYSTVRRSLAEADCLAYTEG